MGLYLIPCRQCDRLFYWFSGNLSQRCSVCTRAPVTLPITEGPKPERHNTVQSWCARCKWAAQHYALVHHIRVRGTI